MNAVSRDNVGIGHNVGLDMKEGSGNTLIGYNTARGMTTGSYNTYLGASMVGLPLTQDNVVAISDGQGDIRFYSPASKNVLFGTTTDIPTAKVAIDSTTKGFRPPIMTTTQRDAIVTPAEGLMLFNNVTHKLAYYNGTVWVEV